ncbi:hypothetical protein GCM10023081_46570 [Arthrobacter ginkgonis]|uniref:HTH cro/C1-type domain-containing protein n=1 Tax=Arthrobacter ginkgonis TaxID=1630594 RepID=A0ABP7DFU2_9MICC
MSDQDMKRRIGELVTESTAELGLSRNQLADKAGVAVGTLYNLESARTWPQPARLRRITDALGWKPRAVDRLLTSGKEPAEVTLEDLRESSWSDTESKAAHDISDEALVVELTTRLQMKNMELDRLKRRVEELERATPPSPVVPLRFDQQLPFAAHPGMRLDTEQHPDDLGEESQE